MNSTVYVYHGPRNLIAIHLTDVAFWDYCLMGNTRRAAVQMWFDFVAPDLSDIAYLQCKGVG